MILEGYLSRITRERNCLHGLTHASPKGKLSFYCHEDCLAAARVKADYAQAVTEYNNAIKQPIFENLQLPKQLILDLQSLLLGSARRYSKDYPSQNRRRVRPKICNLTTRSM